VTRPIDLFALVRKHEGAGGSEMIPFGPGTGWMWRSVIANAGTWGSARRRCCCCREPRAPAGPAADLLSGHFGGFRPKVETMPAVVTRTIEVVVAVGEHSAPLRPAHDTPGLVDAGIGEGWIRCRPGAAGCTARTAHTQQTRSDKTADGTKPGGEDAASAKPPAVDGHGS